MAGVYEDARHAYLHEVLIRRVGCSAALAVIYGDVMQRLLVMGALNFGVRVECRDLNVLPTAEVRFHIIPGGFCRMGDTRSSGHAQSGAHDISTTCESLPVPVCSA